MATCPKWMAGECYHEDYTNSMKEKMCYCPAYVCVQPVEALQYFSS